MSRIPLVGKVLVENQVVADELREAFDINGVFVVNLISSPGSGKTALLEKTLASYSPGRHVAVLTGDIQTDSDAARLKRYGFPVRQITTEGTCHLDARMIKKAIEGWDLADLEILFIENVGNLVCPTSYDLGEHKKIVMLSTAEGEEKPLKYPGIFFKAELMIINKVDLLPYVPFNVERAKENARQINPDLNIIETSCTSEAGLTEWLCWLEHEVDENRIAWPASMDIAFH